MLNVEIVLEASTQIRALLKATPEQSRMWATAVSEACGFMQPYQFHEVCKAFLPEMTAGRTPAPKQLIAVFHKLKQERGWDRTEEKCGGCNGIRFVYTRLQHRDTNEIVTAMKPCPKCRGTSETKPDWIELPIESADDQAAWDKLSDSSKNAALDYAEVLAKMLKKPEYFERFVDRVVYSKVQK